MNLSLNYWHYIVFAVMLILFVLGSMGAMRQPIKKLRTPMIVSLAVFISLISAFSVFVVDKYTKKVQLYKFENKRILSIEKIIYTGIVKNEGSHEIGDVTFEIKIVNKGHATGNVKGGDFYAPSGFFNFFTGGAGFLYKPQSITKKFVVAQNLKPGEAKSFRVYFDYPPYFRSVSQFAKVYGH